MSSLRPLSALQRRNVVRLVCDGIPRFSVGSVKDLSYSGAYEEILDVTGCEVGVNGVTMTPEGIKRITKLNLKYINCASKFLREYRKVVPLAPVAERKDAAS